DGAETARSQISKAKITDAPANRDVTPLANVLHNLRSAERDAVRTAEHFAPPPKAIRATALPRVEQESVIQSPGDSGASAEADLSAQFMSPEEIGAKASAKDIVETSVFAPPRVMPGVAFVVQAYMHVPAEMFKVLGMANRFDKKANRVATRSLNKRIARGARIEIFLDCPSLLIDEPVRTIVWNGATECVHFHVKTKHGTASIIEANFYINIGGITVGDIAFELQVSTEVGNMSTQAAANTRATRYEHAFISYSRRDFD